MAEDRETGRENEVEKERRRGGVERLNEKKKYKRERERDRMYLLQRVNSNNWRCIFLYNCAIKIQKKYNH